MCRVSLSFSTSETRGKRERFRYDNRATRHVRDNTDRLPLWLTPPPSLALTPSSSPPRSVWDESHHHLRGGVSDYTRSRVRCPQTRLLPSASIIQRVHTLWIMSHNGGCVPSENPPLSNPFRRNPWFVRTYRKYRILERKDEWRGKIALEQTSLDGRLSGERNCYVRAMSGERVTIVFEKKKKKNYRS